MKTVFLYIGRFSGGGGLADAALGYVDAIKTAGFPVVLCDYNTGDQVGSGVPGVSYSKSRDRAAFQSTPGTRIIAIFHDVPNELTRVDYEGAVRLVAFTVNETAEYPEYWARRLMDAHEVWTASAFNMENIGQAIPPFMLRNVPHCYTDGFTQFARSYLAKTKRQSNVPTFLTVCSNIERRQLKLFADAFLRAREKGHQFTFTIKTRLSATAEVEAALGDTEPYRDFLRIEPANLDRSAMYDYLSRFDAFINTEWGRGWDLPGFFSLALGKIYIAPDFGGNVDFMDNINTIRIPIEFLEYVDDDIIKNKLLYSGCKGAFSSEDVIVTAIEAALTQIKNPSPEVPERMLSYYSPASIGDRIKSASELEEYDFYARGAPIVHVRYRGSGKSDAQNPEAEKRPYSSPRAIQISETLRRWPIAHDTARYFYRRFIR